MSTLRFGTLRSQPFTGLGNEEENMYSKEGLLHSHMFILVQSIDPTTIVFLKR